MDAAALLKEIDAAADALDWFKLPILVSTAFVVVGLVVEYRPLFHKLHWHHLDPDVAWEFVGGAIVTFAIATEVGLTFFASSAETKLRSATQQYVSSIESETERLRQANLELEKKLAPRRLNPEQENTLVAVLQKLGERRIVIASYAFDIEGIVFAGQIRRLLIRANMRGQGEVGSHIPSSAPIITGIRVTGDDKVLVAALKKAFAADEIALSPDDFVPGKELLEFPKLIGEEATIFVGVKPPE